MKSDTDRPDVEASYGEGVDNQRRTNELGWTLQSRCEKEYYRGPHRISARLEAKLSEVRKAKADKAASFSHRIAEENAAREERQRRTIILKIVDGLVGAGLSELRKADDDAIRAAVTEKFDILSRELSKSVIIDVYGNIECDGRMQEAQRFLRSMRPSLSRTSEDAACRIVLREFSLIERERLSSAFDPDDFPHDGRQFEYWLALSLEKFGWEVQVTQGSGDQGVDLVARKENLVVAIQAKCYEGRVGNAAVQEIYAGAAHLGICHAAVIATSGYTASARALSRSTRVQLLYTSDLPRLDTILSSISLTR